MLATARIFSISHCDEHTEYTQILKGAIHAPVICNNEPFPLVFL